jgi:hypothetical protein
MTTTKGYAIKGPDGLLPFTIPVVTQKDRDELRDGFEYVPVTITEGEPKAVGIVGEDVFEGPDVWETVEWSSGERPPVGTKLYASPPATLALLREAKKLLEYVDKLDFLDGRHIPGYGLREILCKHIEAVLEGGKDGE